MSGLSDHRDLIAFRDHALQRANWQPGKPRTACTNRTTFGRPKPADHANCGGDRCGCPCHQPTDPDRLLWQRLADEVDRYLTGSQDGHNQPPEGTEALF